jgi:hypothetical protein
MQGLSLIRRMTGYGTERGLSPGTRTEPIRSQHVRSTSNNDRIGATRPKDSKWRILGIGDSLPPPAPRERRHRGLAHRLIAVRRRAVFLMPIGEGP